MTGAGREDETVLVLAPLGRDAELACKMLGEAGLSCRHCRDVDDLHNQPLEHAGAILLTEEVLFEEAVCHLAALLDAQPEWSNLSVVVFVDGNGRRATWGNRKLADALGLSRDIVLLERPVQVATFVSVMRSAVLGRRRQYELRDQLAARRQAEEQAQMLAGEMKHRVKNSLAMVGAIASQTFRNAESVDDALQAFSARLGSMARAQDLLTQNGSDSADLHELVGQALDPYRRSDWDQRFAINGPPVRIASQLATSLAMAMHELATNAVKYGALSVDSGGVAISWSVEEAADAKLLQLEWREHGGPPVTLPTQRGFGSRLIERALAAEAGGQASIDFEPGGVVCELSVSLGK